MKRTILNLIAALTLTLFPVGAMAGTAYAACGTPSDSKTQVLHGVGETGGDCSSSGVSNVISDIVQILSIVVGIAAVIAIISAGFKYITSGGEASKVANAKSTLIYALVGLVVAALAQFLVHFVLTQSTKAGLPTCGQHQTPAHDNCVAR